MESSGKSVEGHDCSKSRELEDDDEQEEQKVEQFFSLIRSFQEARNRRKWELEEKERKRKVRKVSKEKSSWVPSFEWQDFTDEIQYSRKPPLIFPAPCSNNNQQDKKPRHHQLQEQEEEQVDDGLNLKLAL